MGATIEVAAMPTPALASKSEGIKPVVADLKQSGEPTISKTIKGNPEENRDESNTSHSTKSVNEDGKSDEKPSATEGKQAGKSEEQETEQDLYKDITDKIREHVEQLNLDKNTKQELFDSYLDELFNKDKKKDKDDKLVDNLAEAVRLIILLVRLLWLSTKPNPTGKYSGKDLILSDTPPEGDNPNQLAKLLGEEDPRESWREFKKEVEKINNATFSELTAHVLQANSRNRGKQFKLQRSDKGRNGIKEIFGNNMREVKRQNSRFAKAQTSGRRR